MKGLLYKDFCMMKKYCRSYLLIIIIFMIVSIFNVGNNMFFAFYPCLIVGMIPTNLLSYDEHSKWNEYSKVFPYSPKEIVSSKYLIGLISLVVVVVVNTICQSIINKINNMFLFGACMITVSLVVSSMPLVFMFRFGVEKGRMAYYVLLGFFVALSFMFTNIIEGIEVLRINEYLLSVLLIIVGIVLYLIMWNASIKLYSKNKQR